MKQFFYSIFFLLFLICLPDLSFAQEKTEHKNGELENKHFIGFTYAQTFIRKGANEDNLNDRGHFVPAIGMDYFYRIHHKWELGIMLDYELGTYIIPRKDNLIRENAFIIALIAAYTLTDRWNLYVGGGIELEKHKNLIVGRFGGEHLFPLKNNWYIPLGLFFDVKEGYDAWSLSVGIAKEF